MWQCAATRRPPLHCGQRSPALPQVVAGDVRRPLLPQGAFTGGRSPRPGQPRVGARACVLNVVAGNAGRDISDGEVRRAGSSHLSVSSIYIMTIQSVRALAPPARCAGPGVARRSGPSRPGSRRACRGPNPVILPNLVVVTKPNKVETEKLPTFCRTTVTLMNVMIASALAPPDCVLSRAPPRTGDPACHTRGARSFDMLV